MDGEYGSRQRDGKWPTRGRWNLDGLPDWYVELVGGLARDLTAWRRHDAGKHLDPRTDPRRPPSPGPMERRHANG